MSSTNDPTPSPQVRDVDRELAAELEDTAIRWETREAAIKTASEVIARHLAPEREEAERWRRYVEGDAGCPCCDLALECSEDCTFAEFYPDDAERMAWARVALSPAPAPQGEPKTDCTRCDGAGWLWRHELDAPEGPYEQGIDDTRYSCPDCEAGAPQGEKGGN